MQNVEEIQAEERALTHAVCRSAILVGDTLLDQNAILFIYLKCGSTLKIGYNDNRYVSSAGTEPYGKSKLAIKSDACIFTTAHGLPMLSKVVWNSTVPLWG